MCEVEDFLLNVRTVWFILIVINFIFGVCGIVTCSLKLNKHANEEVRDGFFKLSVMFATCNLLLSVLLLVAVIKKNQKYAFFCAFLSFVSLFFAVIHIESSTTANIPFLIIFVIVGILFFFWFCIFAAYQFLYQEHKNWSDVEATYPM